MTRLLYIDIDSLRPDHLGCYGYRRNTSPVIDSLAQNGMRFTNVYTSDNPCLPSRTALFSGRFGFHTGVVGHGGTASQPFIEGETREFTDTFRETSWPVLLRRVGMRTATVSAFGDRHSAWHFYAGFDDIRNPAFGRMERAEDINHHAAAWLKEHGRRDSWFLHLNYWDAHTPYRTPHEFGNPFGAEPLSDWFSEEMLASSWDGYGPHSPQDLSGFDAYRRDTWPRVPAQLDSMASLKRWIDGYDTGIRYTDHHIGQILNLLADLGVLDDTAIVVSADHGECQGELNVWGDHHTADLLTCHVPLVVRWPGLPAGVVHDALHYQIDWAATSLEFAGSAVPDNWDGVSFADALSNGRDMGRTSLVLGHGAWTVSRSVRWDRYLCMQVFHDGYMDLEPLMLFDAVNDPHEERNLASARPEVVDRAMRLLAEWEREVFLSSLYNVDPLMTVLREGGPFHVRGQLPSYLERLRSTGRRVAADCLESRYACSTAH